MRSFCTFGTQTIHRLHRCLRSRRNPRTSTRTQERQRQAFVEIAPEVFTFFDAVSIVASIASLVLSIVAIWIAIHFQRKTDEVNRETQGMLEETRTLARTIKEDVMDELREYGKSMRGQILSNFPVQVGSVSLPKDIALSFSPNDSNHQESPRPENERETTSGVKLQHNPPASSSE